MSTKTKVNFGITYKPKIKFWKFLLQIMIVSIIVVGIETLDYFVVAKYFGTWEGNVGDDLNNNKILNLQTWVDKVMPWCTPLYAYYILWPFAWFVVLPLCIYLSSGKHGYYQYVINSILMYIAGLIIYALIPTTCSPGEFIGKNGWDSAINKPFQSQITNLATDTNNVYGSCPSYHNYWASLFFFFGLKRGVKKYWSIPMVFIGILITISTLALHQHNIIDVIITYIMTSSFIGFERKHDLANKFEIFLNKLFKVQTKITL